MNQGQRMVHSLTCRNDFSCHFWWDVVSGRWSNGNCTQILRRVLQVKGTAGVFPRSVTFKNKSKSRTFSVASSVACTSPLVIATNVGLFDILTVSNSASLRSFLLLLVLMSPESTANYLSLELHAGSAASKIHCSFVFLCELKRYSSQVSTRLRGHIALVSQSSSGDLSSNFTA